MERNLPFTVPTPNNITFSEADLEDYPWLRESPRYYTAVRLVGKGKYSEAYVGYPSDREGKPHASAPDAKVVIKFPILGDHYDSAQIRDRLYLMRDQARVERKHIRNRLRLCPYANPTIDVVDVPHANDVYDILGTVQPYLSSEHPMCAMSVNDWLDERGYTQRSVAELEPLTEKWKCYPDRTEWLNIAMRIAVALRDIHMRRVTHGDVHPGNVFLCENPSRAMLIDFGQSFLVTPDKNWTERKLNPFLAPERSGNPFHLNEQIDVYSYGMLLFYLACGNTKPIPDEIHLPIGMRRVYIKDVIRQENPGLILKEPKIVDIISLCTAIDPCDRMRMVDVVEDLSILTHPESTLTLPVAKEMANSLDAIQKSIEKEAINQNRLLMRLLRYEVRELEHTLEGLEVADMVEFTGTRKHLLRKLVSIFDSLEEGDSWTTVTTPAVWQQGALGLGGSYTSATIRALLRGVAVRRTYVVSVEELGFAYCQRFLERLRQSDATASAPLGHALDKAMKRYDAELAEGRAARTPLPKFMTDHITRFGKVLSSLQILVNDESIPQKMIFESNDVDIHGSGGLYLGLHIVGTLAEAGAIRAANPASLIHLSKEPDVAKKWTLVVTDIHGRNEDPEKKDTPQLRLHAFRVFKSALGGVPQDRLHGMRILMRDSVNIGKDSKAIWQAAEAAKP